MQFFASSTGPGRGKPWSHDKSGTYYARPSTSAARSSVVATLAVARSNAGARLHLLFKYAYEERTMSLEGQQIGRYHLLRLLGSGGMGEVYLASDPRINRQVAIKLIRAEATEDHDNDVARKATQLFEREARAIATLDHPHILPLFDYGAGDLNGT